MNDHIKTPLLSYEDILSPQEYIELIKNKPLSHIASTDIIPPTLGSPGFGQIRVKYNTPVFRPKSL